MIMILLHYPIGVKELLEMAPQTVDMLLAGLDWAGRIKTDTGEKTE